MAGRLLAALIVWFGISSVCLWGQGWEHLPLAEPAKIVALDNEAPRLHPCVENVVWDRQGRLWLNTCGAIASEYRMPILQYDGYSLAQVNMAEYQLRGQISSKLLPWTGREAIWGIINDRENGRVFRFQADGNRHFYYPALPKTVTDVVTDDYYQFWVGVQRARFFQIYHWNGLFFQFVLAGEWPSSPANVNAQLSPYRMRLYHHEGRLWITNNTPFVFRYDIQQAKLDTLWLADRPHHSEEAWTNSPAIVAQGDTTYLLLKTLQPGLYRHVEGDTALTPVTDLPRGWICTDLFEDNRGQILFAFTDAQQRDRLILRDRNGQRKDYSVFTTLAHDIRAYHAEDFARQLYLTTSKGAYIATVKQATSIATYLDISIRRLVELPEGDVLASTQARSIYLLKPNRTRDTTARPPPSVELLKDFSGRYFLSSPDGRAWVLRPRQLAAIGANGTITEEHELQIDSGTAKIGVFTEPYTFLFFTNPSSKLYRCDLRTGKTDLLLFANGAPFIAPSTVQHICVDRRGILYLATSAGFFRIDHSRKQWELLGTTEDFPDFRFLFIHEAPNGWLWLGTVNSGVIIYDPLRGQVVKVLNLSKGLSNNTVVSMLPDDEGDIWVATYNGLNIISPEGDILANIHEENGLSYYEFNRFSYMKGRDGRLWFGTLRGLNVIDPQELKAELRKGEKTQLYLREVDYYDKSKDRQLGLQNPDLSDLQRIRLPATRRNLSILVGMSNYGHTERNRYAYRLEGMHEDWIYLGPSHQLELTNLPAGRYRILIKGIDHRGLWTQPVIIPIRVGEFFYRQRWFYLLIFSAFLLVASFWIRRLRTEKSRLETEVLNRTQQIRRDKELIERQARELQQLDELKGRFFTNISHELRTPITLITAPAEQMLRQSAHKLENGMRQSLQLIYNNGRRLLKLVEELLDLSRLEANKIRLEETPTPIADFCRRVFHNFSSRAEAAQIDYQFQADELEDDWRLIDRSRLEKIISNLLSNAMKFTPRGGKVSLHLRKSENNTLIQVSDTGRGIPSEDLPHVFERYFQTKNKKLASTGGTGIGLALSSELARLMQGTLTVESEWGRGSVFTLSLPLRSAEAHVPPALAPAFEEMAVTTQGDAITDDTLAGIASKGDTDLLIVEDNTDMQQLIISLLPPHYRCRTADNGAEAWGLLRGSSPHSYRPDLIISDIMMPLMDGYRLLDLLKNQADLRHIPVIMLTSRSAEEDKLQALRLGVDDYLTKPFSPRELTLRVANLLENAGRRQAYREKYSGDTSPTSPTVDQSWLQELEQAAQHALDKGMNLSKSYLADQMALSERQLLRRLKSLTGLTIQQYTLETKLQRARRLLDNRTYATISEVAYASGFNSPGYFSRIYEQHFGTRPGR